MIVVDQVKFKRCVIDWFEKNNFPRGPIARLDYHPANQLALKGKDFLMLEKFIAHNGYPIILGYYVDTKGILHCRHFYRSNSESVWRVGTGFRKDGSWIKGAEGHSEDMPGGYIFEGQVHHELDEAFELQSPTIEGPGLDLFKTVSECPEIKRYMVRPSNILGEVSEVIAEYAMQRQRVKALPDDIFNHDVAKENQVTFQLQVKPKIRGIPSSDIPAQLKRLTPLWEHINTSLEHLTGSYEFKHAMLNESCASEIYRLGDSTMLEIAYSENKPRKFKTNNGITCEINSPVCWVKSAHVGAEVSSFGNYLKYPEDLCFLVQKPMDYISQCSSEVKKRMGYSGDAGMNSNVINERYLLLALYDEKYSPLIQGFKIKKDFRLFKWSSEKHVTMVTCLDRYKTDHFDIFKAAVLASCVTYLGYHRNPSNQNARSTSGHSGTGIEKVERFQLHIEACMSYDEVNKSIYDLFAENKIGREKYFFSAIRTKGNSYFSVFCRTMLPLLNELNLVCKNGKGAIDPVFRTACETLYNKRKGLVTSDAWARFSLKAVLVNCVESGATISEENRNTLLAAVKDK